MKARIRIELPPGVEVTPDVRARLAKAIQARLGCDPDCEHDLEKSESTRKLPHRAPQDAIEKSTALYQRMMRSMLDEIAAVLAE